MTFGVNPFGYTSGPSGPLQSKRPRTHTDKGAFLGHPQALGSAAWPSPGRAPWPGAGAWRSTGGDLPVHGCGPWPTNIRSTSRRGQGSGDGNWRRPTTAATNPGAGSPLGGLGSLAAWAGHECSTGDAWRTMGHAVEAPVREHAQRATGEPHWPGLHPPAPQLLTPARVLHFRLNGSTNPSSGRS